MWPLILIFFPLVFGTAPRVGIFFILTGETGNDVLCNSSGNIPSQNVQLAVSMKDGIINCDVLPAGRMQSKATSVSKVKSVQLVLRGEAPGVKLTDKILGVYMSQSTVLEPSRLGIRDDKGDFLVTLDTKTTTGEVIPVKCPFDKFPKKAVIEISVDENENGLNIKCKMPHFRGKGVKRLADVKAVAIKCREGCEITHFDEQSFIPYKTSQNELRTINKNVNVARGSQSRTLSATLHKKPEKWTFLSVGPPTGMNEVIADAPQDLSPLRVYPYHKAGDEVGLEVNLKNIAEDQKVSSAESIGDGKTKNIDDIRSLTLEKRPPGEEESQEVRVLRAVAPTKEYNYKDFKNNQSSHPTAGKIYTPLK